MRRILHVVAVAGALASLWAAIPSTAGAVTWHNTGSGSFHATGVGGVWAVTGSGGTNNLTCTNSTSTGTAPTGSFVGATYQGTSTTFFHPCFLSGTSTYMHCHTVRIWEVTVVIGTEHWTKWKDKTTCRVYLTAVNVALCDVEGTTPGGYRNPIGATPGRFTMDASSTLTVTHASGTACSSLLGSATSGIAHMSEQTLTLTSGGPIITRTA